MQDNGQSTCNSPFTSSSSCGFYPFPDRLALSHFTAHICQKSAKLISSWINSWKFETNVRWRNLSYSNWDINSYPSELIGVLMWVENLQIYQWTFILSTFDHFLRICSFVMIYCLICESLRKHRMMQKLIEFVLKFGFWLLDFEFESVSWV